VQLLTFQIGQHLLAIPAQQVLSVGREQGGQRAAAKADKVDLAGLLGIAAGLDGQRPVIRSNQGGRIIELQVDRILALENCDDGAVRPWPALLRTLAIYSGVSVIDGRLFPILDIGRFKDWRKGRRR